LSYGLLCSFFRDLRLCIRWYQFIGLEIWVALSVDLSSISRL
jgi:hypothetical protein